MRERLIRRYSACFKQQVVSELEGGRFSSLEQARLHYEIGGRMTIQTWLKRYGRGHLQAKVVRVEKPNEADRIAALKRQVADLERALGQTQAQNVLHQAYLELACEQLGQDVESFKKKSGGRLCTGRSSGRPTAG